jgi:uncharacterized protein (DUF2384 family)
MASLLEHVLLDAHDPATGKVSVAGLRRLFGLSNAEVAGIAGVTARAIRQSATSARVQTRLTRFLDLAGRARRLLGGDLALVRIWLRAPHPDLQMQTPVALLCEGKFEKVDALLRP